MSSIVSEHKLICKFKNKEMSDYRENYFYVQKPKHKISTGYMPGETLLL